MDELLIDFYDLVNPDKIDNYDKIMLFITTHGTDAFNARLDAKYGFNLITIKARYSEIRSHLYGLFSVLDSSRLPQVDYFTRWILRHGLENFEHFLLHEYGLVLGESSH
jgi:hypothetical protein